MIQSLQTCLGVVKNSKFFHSKSNFLFKVILVGDSNCGKSSLIRRFENDEYIDNKGKTVGIEFVIFTLKKKSTKQIKGEKYNSQLQIVK
jgi:GTPase SAR1 family protein